MEKLTSRDYAILEDAKPFKTYIKTILGKVRIVILSPFSGEPEEVILEGNPRAKNNESSLIDVYSNKEDMYFRRANSYHFKNGNIIEYTRKGEPKISEDELANSLTDDQMRELLNSKFLSLQSKVNKMTSVAPVFRMRELAIEMDKSESYIKFLEGKLSELQQSEYAQYEPVQKENGE